MGALPKFRDGVIAHRRSCSTVAPPISVGSGLHRPIDRFSSGEAGTQLQSEISPGWVKRELMFMTSSGGD
uniref:Uncharacterized protein n=1 Tax=Zea mays TaxID=4577 RepID=A0A804UJB7_MAIZE